MLLSKRPVMLGVFLAALATSSTASSAPVWVGDFETNDLKQWDGLLHGEHISVVDMPVIQGMHSAQVQLTNDAVWPNGLKRVELHHSPGPGRTAEGAELYFAWSFFLPDALPTDPSQEIGYWESNQSYHQMMAFDVAGQDITFATRMPMNVEQWKAQGVVTPAVWHRIALHVKWSKDAAQGYVDAWFDGKQVVNHGGAQTLADDNDHFTQVGLLRGAIEFMDSPIIYIDDAVEGDSVADVHPDLPTGSGGAGGGGGGGGPASATSAASSVSAAASTSAATSGAGGAGGPSATPDDGGGCGCRTAGDEGDGRFAGFLALLFAASLAGRRPKLLRHPR